MLIDVHTHIGLDLGFMLRGWWPYASTAVDLIGHMNAEGVDRAVCFPFGLPSAFDPYAFADRQAVELLPGRVPFDRENALLLQEIDRLQLGDRLSALAMFDPSRQVDEQIENLTPLIGRISGLKVQATIIESPIAALLNVGRPLMDFAKAHDLPVLMHTSVIEVDIWSQVSDCLEVAAANPTVRFNLAHSLRFNERHLRDAADTTNVWVDCSAHLAHCDGAAMEQTYVASRNDRVDADYTRPADVLKAIFDILPQRYMWGSDNPFMSWADDTIASIHSYAEEVDVLQALPAHIQTAMGDQSPRAWLGWT